MKPIEHVNIVGMGALGLLFGEPIRRNAGAQGQPRYVMDAARKARHEKDVYTINRQVIRPVMITPEEAEPADLVLVGVKYPALDDAIGLMASSVGKSAVTRPSAKISSVPSTGVNTSGAKVSRSS